MPSVNKKEEREINLAELTNEQLKKVFGESGTEEYNGYFFEDPNADFRDDRRVDIIEEMRRTDSQVKATLNALKAPMLKVDWFVEGEDEEVVQFVEDTLFGMRRSWKDFLRESLAYLDFGFYVFELIWDVQDGNIVLVDLEPRIPNSIEKWETQDGEEGITQWIRTDDTDKTQASIPKEKLLILTNDKEGTDLTGQSVLRPAYKHYKFKDTAYRVQGISIERNAVGTPTVFLPETYDQDQKDKAAEAAKNMRSNEQSHMVLPSGFEFEIKTPDGGIPEKMIDNAIAHHDRKIVSSVLANFLNLGEGSTGSFALSRDQSSFFLKHVKDKAEYVAEQITKQVIHKVVRKRFGKDVQVPKLKFSPLGDIDFKEMSESLSVLAQSGLIEINDDVRRHTHKIFDLPEPEEQKESDQNQKDPESSDDQEKESMKENIKPSMFVEKEYSPFRTLTKFEEREDFESLNEQFNELETTIEEEMTDVTKKESDRFLNSLDEKIDKGSIAAIAGMSFLIKGKVKKVIKNVVEDAFEAGKADAANLMNVDRPTTPRKVKSLKNLEVEEIAERYTTEMTSTATNKARQAISANASKPATIAATRDELNNAASRMITNLAGTVPGQYVNRGRKEVFMDNINRIQKFQRSEVLDSRTCNVCLSLDKRVVEADDPAAQMDLVHTHCRGVWVPIFTTEEAPENNPIPKTVADKFDTVDGRPVINSFTQLKKPIQRQSNKEAQKIVKERLT